MWKIINTAGQDSDDNMAHAHCMLDNTDYRHTLRICNTYCFSTATMASMLHNSLSCYNRSRECLWRDTHRVLVQNTLRFIVFFLFGDSPASEFYMPTFQNTMSLPSC